MDIERRGTPPYVVWTDYETRNVDGFVHIPQHGYNGDNFLKALWEVFDLTDGGRLCATIEGGVHIKDSTGAVIFAASNPDDVTVLFQMDNAGMDRVKIVEEQSIHTSGGSELDS